MKLLSYTCVLCLLLSGLSFAERSVHQIVDSSGLQGGLIVHVGCGRGEITADLYKKGRQPAIVPIDKSAGEKTNAKTDNHSR